MMFLRRVLRPVSLPIRGGSCRRVPFSTESAVVTPEEFRAAHNISILQDYGDKVVVDSKYDPILSFRHNNIAPAITKTLLKQGFTEPTPIQAQCWPIALAGKDLIAVARTGSGKTCGFLVPGIHNIFSDKSVPRNSIPKILVIAPTRELAVQIHAEAEKLSSPYMLRSVCLYGGASKVPQKRQLAKGADIIVGTAGRINDLLDEGVLDLGEIKYLVLDEADRMLDMGFEPQLRSIVRYLPSTRQTVFFTATWPTEVKQLASMYSSSPVRVVVGDVDALNANINITQHIVEVTHMKKNAKLLEILEHISEETEKGGRAVPKCLIFVGTKVDCDDVTATLEQNGYPARALHGDKTQGVRESILQQFRRGTANIVVATDVASRGLDVKDIEVVINYDFPNDGVASYVHRIGRTGRGNNSGHSITFFNGSNRTYAKDLVDVLRRSKQEVPEFLLKLSANHRDQDSMMNKRNSRYGGGFYSDSDSRSRRSSSSWDMGNRNSSGARQNFFEQSRTHRPIRGFNNDDSDNEMGYFGSKSRQHSPSSSPRRSSMTPRGGYRDNDFNDDFQKDGFVNHFGAGDRRSGGGSFQTNKGRGQRSNFIDRDDDYEEDRFPRHRSSSPSHSKSFDRPSKKGSSKRFDNAYEDFFDE